MVNMKFLATKKFNISLVCGAHLRNIFFNPQREISYLHMARLYPLCVVFQSLIFKPPVYHPVVNVDTGELDVKRNFPKWR